MANRSFSLVDRKIAEAEFFLQKLPGCGFDFFAVQCYVSAYIAAIRSVTFTLQAVLSSVPGFEPWYSTKQSELRSDELARFFHDFRTKNQHVGENAVRGGSSAPNRPTLYWFRPTDDLPEVPDCDVETACRKHFVTILELVYDCYLEFGTVIDSKQHYTAEHCATLGKSIEDVELELFGLPPGSAPDGYSEAYRWQYIRDNMTGCEINGLFSKYLGRVTPEPPRLPPLKEVV